MDGWDHDNFSFNILNLPASFVTPCCLVRTWAFIWAVVSTLLDYRFWHFPGLCGVVVLSRLLGIASSIMWKAFTFQQPIKTIFGVYNQITSFRHPLKQTVGVTHQFRWSGRNHLPQGFWYGCNYFQGHIETNRFSFYPYIFNCFPRLQCPWQTSLHIDPMLLPFLE